MADAAAATAAAAAAAALLDDDVSVAPDTSVTTDTPSTSDGTVSSTAPSSTTIESPPRPSASSEDPEGSPVCPDFYVRPPSSTKEHFRDISFLGPFTLHRFFILLWLAGSGVGLYFLQNFFWPPSDDIDLGWTLLGLIWLVPLPGAIAYVIGAVWFRYNTRLDDVQKMEHKIALRIVSRGINTECLLSTIRRCQQEMKRNPLFPYLIEVVTDGDVFSAPPDPDVLHLRVPSTYKPAAGAKFKARALHYACEYSLVPPETWVVHLDEESQPTSSCLKGIAAMVEKCEREGDTNRIGQGMILYHRSWGTHPLLTLADMRRTGDDMGHFYLQHRIGYTIFGLHGSFVVCRQDVEARIGFDVGPRGSITEDAWWVLLAIQRGYRTVWVDGYMEEQATQSAMDFMRQRRRWYVGLLKVGVFCPVNMRHRILLMYNTISWIILPIVVPLQLVYLALSFAYSKQIALPIRVLSNLVFSTTSLVYLSGLAINMREHGTPWWRVPFWTVLLILLLPVFFVLEIASIILALFSPFSESAKGFHVVQKSASADSEVVESTESD